MEMSCPFDRTADDHINIYPFCGQKITGAAYPSI